jgi:hypothetical protein
MARVAPGIESDAGLLAVTVLDEFVAEIVRQARLQGVRVPAGFFDWATGEATQLVERLARRRLGPDPASATPTKEVKTALRCAVRYWVAPWVVAGFPALRPLFPELTVLARGSQITVLVRTGRWRCGDSCRWRLCDAPASTGDPPPG